MLAWGPEHEFTLKSLLSSGRLYAKWPEKEGNAEDMFSRAIHGKEETFGRDHKSTLGCVLSPGLLYTHRFMGDEAYEVYEVYLRLRKAYDSVRPWD